MISITSITQIKPPLLLAFCLWLMPATLIVNASPGNVVAWGLNDFGQTNVPVAAQSGMTAIAAGGVISMVVPMTGAQKFYRLVKP